jgi:hypothetical protein
MPDLFIRHCLPEKFQRGRTEPGEMKVEATNLALAHLYRGEEGEAGQGRGWAIGCGFVGGVAAALRGDIA